MKSIPELKTWAKSKRDGHIKDVLLPYAILFLFYFFVNLISGLFGHNILSFVLSFLGVGVSGVLIVGITIYMINFISDREPNIEIVWSKFGDSSKIIPVTLMQYGLIFIYSLLLIVPGVIKAISYALIPYILVDGELSGMAVLKKSEEMMNGHKMEFFKLNLSFIGMHLLAVFTLGILEIWILPHHMIAVTKFLNDIKLGSVSNNTQSFVQQPVVQQVPQQSVMQQVYPQQVQNSVCPSCGSPIVPGTVCANCSKLQ